MVKLNFNLKDFKIKEIKEDINLMMFNSKSFTVRDMMQFNNIMEVIANAKLQISY